MLTSNLSVYPCLHPYIGIRNHTQTHGWYVQCLVSIYFVPSFVLITWHRFWSTPTPLYRWAQAGQSALTPKPKAWESQVESRSEISSQALGCFAVKPPWEPQKGANKGQRHTNSPGACAQDNSSVPQMSLFFFPSSFAFKIWLFLSALGWRVFFRQR